MTRRAMQLVRRTGSSLVGLALLAGCGRGCGGCGGGGDARPAPAPASPLASAPLAPAGPAFRDDPTPLPEGVKRGDTCSHPLWFATPTLGASPTRVSGELSGFSGDFGVAEGSGATPWGGRDLVYRVDLRAGDTYRFTLVPKAGSLGLFGFRNCGVPEKSVLFAEASGRPVFFTATEDGPIWLAVDARGGSEASGSFELELFRLSTAAVGQAGPDGLGVAGGADLCDGAPELTPGVRVLGNARGATTQVTEPLRGSSLRWPGPDHFFRLRVTRGTTYRIELDALGQFPGGLYLLPDCATLSGPALAETAASTPLSWTSDRDGTVVVGVDSSEPGVAGAYQIAVALQPAK